MIRKRFRRSSKSGSALALALFAVVLLLLTGASILSLGQTSRIFSIRRVEEVSARSAADCGLTKALWGMNEKLKARQWTRTSILREFDEELPNSDATYSYIAVRAMKLYGDVMPSGNDDLIDFIQLASWKENDFVIKSIGMYNGARKTIYGIVRLQGRGEPGILVRDSITLKSNTLVAGRDSRDPCNPAPDVEVGIGTISTELGKIVLNSGVLMKGNVAVGVEGNPAPGGVVKDLPGFEIEGVSYAMTQDPKFPYVYPPADLVDWGKKIDFKAETKEVGPLGSGLDFESGIYSSIELKNGKEPTILKIDGGDVVLYITGDVDMGQGCEILIRKGSTLNLYVDGDIKAGNSDGFNNQGVPPDLKIWGNWRPDVTGGEVEQKWQLNAKSEYFGQIYAPSANIEVKAKGDLYGAFTTNSFTMMAGGNLFYDGALSEVDLDDKGIRFVLKRWHQQ